MGGVVTKGPGTQGFPFLFKDRMSVCDSLPFHSPPAPGSPRPPPSPCVPAGGELTSQMKLCRPWRKDGCEYTLLFSALCLVKLNFKQMEGLCVSKQLLVSSHELGSGGEALRCSSPPVSSYSKHSCPKLNSLSRGMQR